MKKYIKNIAAAAVMLGSFELSQAAMNQAGRSLARTGTQFGRYVGASGVNAVGSQAGSAIAAPGAGQTRNFIGFGSEMLKYPSAKPLMDLQEKQMGDVYSTKEIIENLPADSDFYTEFASSVQKSTRARDKQVLNRALALSEKLSEEIAANPTFIGVQQMPSDIQFTVPLRFGSSKEVRSLDFKNENKLRHLQFDHDGLYYSIEPLYDTVEFKRKAQFEADKKYFREATEIARDMQRQVIADDPYGFDESGKYVGSENSGMRNAQGDLEEID